MKMAKQRMHGLEKKIKCARSWKSRLLTNLKTELLIRIGKLVTKMRSLRLTQMRTMTVMSIRQKSQNQKYKMTNRML